MDTKSKSSRAAGVLISFLVVALAAAAVFVSYPVVYQNYTRNNDQPAQMSSFVRRIYKANFVLYWELQERMQQKTLRPSEVLLPGFEASEQNILDGEEVLIEFEEDVYFTVSEQNSVTVTGLLDSAVYEWQVYMADSMPNLNYIIIDDEKKTYVSSDNELLVMEPESIQDMESYIAESFRCLIALKPYADGSISIEYIYGCNESSFLSYYRSNTLDNNLWNEMGLYHLGPEYEESLVLPSGVTIIYAVPNQMVLNDVVAYWFGESEALNFAYAGLDNVFLAAGCFVALCALLLPIIKQLRLGELRLAKIPCEIAITVGCIAIEMYEVVYEAAFNTASGSFRQYLQDGGIPDPISTLLLAAFNIAVLMVTFGGMYVSVLSLRQIIEGPGRYFRERVLIGRFCTAVARKVKNCWKALLDIDLTDSSNRLIFIIVAVNFVVLALMCSIWFFGIGVLVFYSIGMFLVLRKYAVEVKKKYAVLLKITRQMSEGNLDVEINEDVGLFNPLKEELQEIQSGFRKAVEEEVKSQNMKTELITNVSHDLKTPLTAIITYIDLMKDPNLTPEDRAQYLDTLDRKAQRLKNLIEDLFEVSKASSRNVTLTLADIDLCALLKQVEFELSDKIEASGIEFRFHLPEEKVIARLDSQKTYRIFENLIVNITKYGLPGTRAYIDLTDMGDRVCAVLKNVSAAEMDFDTTEITERFVRGDKSRNTEGSGLGLAIVKSFTELQGGTFEILVDGDLFKAVVVFWK